MTPITDTREEFPLRLRFQTQFAAHQHESIGEIIHILRSKVARELAEKIVREDKFFVVKIDQGYGHHRVDCIVMTEQEYADKLNSQFEKGLQHAQGFMPTWEAIK
jgi:hypothetical protein